MIDELIAGIVLFKNFTLLTLAAGIIGSPARCDRNKKVFVERKSARRLWIS